MFFEWVNCRWHEYDNADRVSRCFEDRVVASPERTDDALDSARFEHEGSSFAVSDGGRGQSRVCSDSYYLHVPETKDLRGSVQFASFAVHAHQEERYVFHYLD